MRGEIEVNASCFGARRAFSKIAVFGAFKRDVRVYAQIFPDCLKTTLQDIVRGRMNSDSAI